MPEPKFRSRTYKRVQKKLPSGDTVRKYVKRKPKLGTCSETGEKLKGVAHERPYKMSKLGVTSKRPSRPFGGVLSSKAMRAKIKKEARKSQK